MEVLRTEELTKEYGRGDNKVTALDHVSFSVEEGEFVTILGPSGSGKSTLLHLLGGVDVPTKGKVYIAGKSLYDMKENKRTVFRRREIGQIYQFFNLIPVLNVEENISLPVLLDHKKVDREFLASLLKILGLKERIRHLPSELSGGQQQRVAIGRAVMGRPKLLLADEPTGNLDQKNSREIMRLFRTLNEEYGQTILLITHDEKIAAGSKRIIVIEDGRIVKTMRRKRGKL
ncbi:MAG: ABC transporter ATP-binding protein [Lachnospiraceae bacterium]|nr:ABC transporter ATP-binding protein [Dorea sp.]MCI9176932.1 ABC transporter ATP-binding protein [Lachnospiraceae bacterium]